jgi:PAT family beta-lactamase induction signal transducer AmpG
MRLPNLLATPRGRLAAFFLLYITEGIPIGFAGTTMAAHMRRMGVGPAEIGAFVAALYLPWAFKWAAGPVVDVFRSQRWGPRRAWILSMQVLMVASLAFAASLDPVAQIGLVSGIILLHNSFAAVQDVAIDALAVGNLQPDERGRAAGLMFAGANVGQAIGGAGALAFSAAAGYSGAVLMVCAAMLMVTTLVVLPMRENAPHPAAGGSSSSWRAVREGLQAFALTTWQTMKASRPARMGLLVAVLPMGCMSLALALQTNLGVDLGLDDQSLAGVSLATTVLGALGCIIGGVLADRWGRRATLTLAIGGMAVPVLALAVALMVWGEPVKGQPLDDRLPTLFMVACAAYGLFNGFMYGSSMPMFMDITRAAVAATQFTAYTALMNLAITMSARWQGLAVEAYGYATTLLLDIAVGSVVLLFLPLIRPEPKAEPKPDPDPKFRGPDTT